jgi:hypothetical protein
VSTRAISDKAVIANAHTVGNELAPCISTLQTPSVAQSAKQALGTEMGTQYVMATERPLVKALTTAGQQTANLPPVRSRVKSELRAWATLSTGLLALETCRDAAAWQAASFATGSEPAGTQLASALLTAPTPSGWNVLISVMTARQRRAIAQIHNQSIKHVRHLEELTIKLAHAWVAQNGG